jgi:hypothetical protein
VEDDVLGVVVAVEDFDESEPPEPVEDEVPESDEDEPPSDPEPDEPVAVEDELDEPEPDRLSVL